MKFTIEHWLEYGDSIQPTHVVSSTCNHRVSETKHRYAIGELPAHYPMPITNYDAITFLCYDAMLGLFDPNY